MRRPATLVATLLATAFALVACSKPAPVPDPLRAVKTIVVEPASAGGSFDYAGEIRARVESKLSFRVAGKVLERSVDPGAVVRPGQVLARLDARDLRLGQDAAFAAVASADVNLQQAEADFRRYRDLRDQGFISGAELERRETALKVARAQLVQARAQSGVQGNQTAYAALVADASGVVTGVDVEPGMVVAAGTPVLRVAHDGPRDVVFAVPEDKAAAMQALAARGGSVDVRLWGTAGAKVSARLREVAASAEPMTRTYLVKADLSAADLPTLRLGQTATVSVAAPRREGIARVPLSALREDHGRTTVWVVDPATMTAVVREVKVGGAEGNDVVVAAGLGSGDRVVTAGVHVLSPGQKVRLYADPEAPMTALAAASASTR
jgi:RND family efflux transporter MFP subunit